MTTIKGVLTSLLLVLMSSYTFADIGSSDAGFRGLPGTVNETTASDGKAIVNTPDKPVHCVSGCSQAEDCRNNQPSPPEGYMWRCNHDVSKAGACDGTCEKIEIPASEAE